MRDPQLANHCNQKNTQLIPSCSLGCTIANLLLQALLELHSKTINQLKSRSKKEIHERDTKQEVSVYFSNLLKFEQLNKENRLDIVEK